MWSLIQYVLSFDTNHIKPSITVNLQAIKKSKLSQSIKSIRSKIKVHKSDCGRGIFQFQFNRSTFNMLRQIVLLALCSFTLGQRTYLRADGNSDGTYALLSRVLGGTPYEVPDCVHPIRHIIQRNDPDLGVPVFQFASHVDIDNDRCRVFDRSRTEIKSYARSPDHMKCFLGEEVSYSWSVRLNSQFQASTSFTHIFQVKPVGGSATLPHITLTAQRFTNGQSVRTWKKTQISDISLFLLFQVLRVIHRAFGAPDTVLWQGELIAYLGRWLHIVTEYTCAPNGTFHIRIRRMDTNSQLMTFTSNSLTMWNAGNTFLRPKWGIYRSHNDRANLRDEFVLFNNICLGKGKPLCN